MSTTGWSVDLDHACPGCAEEVAWHRYVGADTPAAYNLSDPDLADAAMNAPAGMNGAPMAEAQADSLLARFFMAQGDEDAATAEHTPVYPCDIASLRLAQHTSDLQDMTKQRDAALHALERLQPVLADARTMVPPGGASSLP